MVEETGSGESTERGGAPLGFSLARTLGKFERECAAALEWLPSINTPELLPEKSRVHNELQALFAIEGNRNAAVVAFSFLNFGLYLSACFTVVPLGLIPVAEDTASRPAILALWLAVAWIGCFGAQRLLLKDVGMARRAILWAPAAGFAVWGIAWLYSTGLRGSFQALRDALGVSPHMREWGFYSAALMIAHLSMVFFLLAYQMRLTLSRLILVIFAPLAFYSIFVAVWTATGRNTHLDFLVLCGRRLLFVFAAFQTAYFVGGAMIGYAFDRRMRTRLPELMILGNILEILVELEDSAKDFRDPGLRRIVVRKLEDVAHCLERRMPNRLTPVDASMDPVLQAAFARKALHVRSLKLPVLLANEDSRVRMVGLLRECLGKAVRGAWGEFPERLEGETPPRKSWRQAAVSLSVALLPLIAVIVVYCWRRSLFNEQAAYVLWGAFAWAAVSLAVIFDPLLGSKIASAKEFLNLARDLVARKP